MKNPILSLVSKRLGVPARAILGPSRVADVVAARHMVIQLAHEAGHTDTEVACLINHAPGLVHYVVKSAKPRDHAWLQCRDEIRSTLRFNPRSHV